MSSADSQFFSHAFRHNAAEWFTANVKKMIVFATVVLAIFVAYLLYGTYIERRESEFARDFYLEVLAKNPQGEARQIALDALRTRYKSLDITRFLDMDALVAAHDASDWVKLETLTRALLQKEKNTDLHVLFALVLARATENQGAYDRSLAALETLIALPKTSPYRGLARAETGRLLILSGKREEGRRLLSELLKETATPVSPPLKAWIEDVLIGLQVSDGHTS